MLFTEETKNNVQNCAKNHIKQKTGKKIAHYLQNLSVHKMSFILSFGKVQTFQFVEVEDHAFNDSPTEPASSRSPMRAFASTRKIFS